MFEKLTRGQWLMSLTAALGLAQEKKDKKDGPKNISTEELEKLMRDEKNIFYLDVRDPKEIEELGTVKGYVNIPLRDLENRLSELPKDKVIVTL